MAHFHPLEVTGVHRTIRDAVVLTLQPKDDTFEFKPGQYLTFRRDFDGTEIRRSYSICAGLDDGVLQVGIKKVDGGAFSTWINETIAPGVTLHAMPPAGRFTPDLSADHARHYLGFAGGSGITPVLSILRSVLSREPQSRFTLVYANRGIHSIMFRDELEDLKNQHMGRLNVIHILGSGVQDIDLFQGRVTPQKCADLFAGWIDIRSVHTAFICGPEPMMLGICTALRDHGLPEDRIKFELFASSQPGRLPQRIAERAARNGKAVHLEIVLDGTPREVPVAAGQSVLDAALAAQLDAPFACRAGVCSTCKCRVIEGEVEMAANHALEDYEVRAGYALSCQAYAVSDKLVVNYDV